MSNGAAQSIPMAYSSGIRWNSVGQIFTEFLAMFTSVTLARLLLPADFGLIALAASFTRFVSVIEYLGTTAVVIQRDETPPGLLNGLLGLNFIAGLFFTTVMFIGAPFLAHWSGEDSVAPIIRVLSVGFVISSLSAVPNALLHREMKFGKLAIITVASTLLQSGTAVLLAVLHFGVWSLVSAFMALTVVSAGMSWVFAGWTPGLKADWRLVRSNASMMLSLTGTNALSSLINDADKFMIAKWLGTSVLGFYSMAVKFALLPPLAIGPIFKTVLLPAFSRLQRDNTDLRDLFWKSDATIAFVTIPMLLGLAVVSRTFVDVVLGPKWTSVHPPMLILCAAGIFQTLAIGTGAILIAKDRPKWLFFFTTARALLTVVGIYAGLQGDLVGVASAIALVSLALALICYLTVCFLIGDKIASFWRVHRATIIASLAMCAVVYLCGYLLRLSSIPQFAELVATVSVGVLTYGFIAWRFRMPQLAHLGEILRGH